jgi:hypothetical protein
MPYSVDSGMRGVLKLSVYEPRALSNGFKPPQSTQQTTHTMDDPLANIAVDVAGDYLADLDIWSPVRTTGGVLAALSAGFAYAFTKARDTLSHHTDPRAVMRRMAVQRLPHTLELVEGATLQLLRRSDALLEKGCCIEAMRKELASKGLVAAQKLALWKAIAHQRMTHVVCHAITHALVINALAVRATLGLVYELRNRDMQDSHTAGPTSSSGPQGLFVNAVLAQLTAQTGFPQTPTHDRAFLRLIDALTTQVMVSARQHTLQALPHTNEWIGQRLPVADVTRWIDATAASVLADLPQIVASAAAAGTTLAASSAATRLHGDDQEDQQDDVSALLDAAADGDGQQVHPLLLHAVVSPSFIEVTRRHATSKQRAAHLCLHDALVAAVANAAAQKRPPQPQPTAESAPSASSSAAPTPPLQDAAAPPMVLGIHAVTALAAPLQQQSVAASAAQRDVGKSTQTRHGDTNIGIIPLPQLTRKFCDALLNANLGAK